MRIRDISEINLSRCNKWHNNGIESWSYADWAVALAGEVGELCNVVKKLNRVRDGLPGNKETAANLITNLRAEVADVYLYLDLFAQRAGIDLESAVAEKFNATSERVGFPERLSVDDPEPRGVRVRHYFDAPGSPRATAIDEVLP